MFPRVLLLVLGFLALSSAFEVKNLLKNLQKREVSASLLSKAGNLNTLIRKRRDAEESAEPTSTEVMSMFRFFLALGWNEDKHDVLADFLEEMSDHSNNVTVIGWQRILDEQGDIKEINTIQLVIPPKPVSDGDASFEDDDDDEDEDDEDAFLPPSTVNEIKEMFEPLADLGIPGSITAEEFNKKGELESIIYMDKDELYGKVEGFSVYNKTATATAQEVSDFIKHIKPGAFGKPSILKYDVDGNLIVDQSKVHPHLLGSVSDTYEANDDMILSGAEVIAQISQQYHQEEIPKQLAIHYNKDYPHYKWRVLVNPSSYYVTRDVALTLTYDNFDLDESSDKEYYVYGIKKEANK